MSNILISTPPTSLATGLLQLDGGVAISSTPVYVADQNNTDSVLSLSTGNVGINTTSTFARLTIANTNTSTSEYLLLASTSTASFYVRNDGFLYNAEKGRISNVLIANISSNSLSSTSSSASGGALYLTGTGTGIGGTTSFTPSAMAHIKGSGSTSATTSLLVQNSSSTNLLKVTDDNVTSMIGRASVGVASINTSIWSAYTEILQIGQLLFGGYSPTPQSFITNNGYFDGSNSRYFRTGGASGINFTNNGSIQFDTFASGTAGNVLATAKSVYFDVSGNVGINQSSPTARLQVKGSGSTSATTSLLVQNSSASTLFEINDAGLIGVGQAPDTGTLPARLKIAPSNGKVANIGYIAAAGVPATLNDGDIYVYGNDLWLHSSFANSSLKGILSSRMKLNGLQSDYFYSSSAAKDFNQFNSSAWATFGWGSLVHSGYSYGNTVLGYQPTSVGVDSRMYDGWLQSVNGNNAYDPCAQLYVDMKGSIFARGVGSGAETDWKKALTDNTNSTTTVGSQTNYPSSKFAIDSTTKGFLPPRMTTGEKLAILTPASGLMVYDTSLNQMSYYNGAVWVNI